MSSFPLGISTLCACLSDKAPSGIRVFPTSVERAVLRMSESESARNWFVRCVNTFMDNGKDLDRWRLADDLAIFAVVQWDSPGPRLVACSVNVVKTEGSLEDYYLDEDEQVLANYLRMDLDYGTLGPLFTHPLPHIHAWSSDATPRFAVEGIGENVVVDFLEWVYRHFYHDQWLRWAEDVCRPDFAGRYSEDTNPLDWIFRAFKESQIAVLRELRDEVKRVKDLLRNEKDQIFDLRASTEDRNLIAYP
jgi:hypothetical protein